MNVEVETATPAIQLSGSGKPYVVEKIDGLERPDLRATSHENSGQDGGEVTEQFHGMRLIGLQGAVVTDTLYEQLSARRALNDAFPIREVISFVVTVWSGEQYRLTGKVVSYKNPIGSQTMSAFRIEVLCDDPLLYDVIEPGGLSVTINKPVPGGYITPYILPVIWEDATGGVIVTNTGNSAVYPIITFSGTVTSYVTITNTTTGEFLRVNLSMVGGDVLVVDMYERTITLNGGSVFGLRSSDSTFWALLEGANQIDLASGGGSDTVTALLERENGYTGI